MVSLARPINAPAESHALTYATFFWAANGVISLYTSIFRHFLIPNTPPFFEMATTTYGTAALGCTFAFALLRYIEGKKVKVVKEKAQINVPKPAQPMRTSVSSNRAIVNASLKARTASNNV